MSEVPRGWVRTTLGEVTKHRSGNGKLIKGNQQQAPRPGLFPAFSASGQDVWVESPEHSGNAVIVSAVGARCGKAFLAQEQWSAVANTHVVWPEAQALDVRWLWWKLNNENFWVKGGSAQPFVKVGATFEHELELPPLAEQRRIVAKLDALAARTIRVGSDLDRIPALVMRYKQALLAKAFSGELTADWRLRNVYSNVAQKSLQEVCVSITDGDHQAPPKADCGVPFITISAMNSGVLDLKRATRFVPHTYLEQLKPSRRAVRGDLLFSVTGSVGIPALVETDDAFVFQRHIAILKVSDRSALSRYVYRMLASPQIANQVQRVATGTAQLTVPLSGLREFLIPIPSLAEQAEVVRLIDTAFAEIDRLAAEAASARKLLDRLDQAILAKAFRGELVPQDPTDEPASVLLDRIRAERGAAPRAKRGRKLRSD